MLMQIIYTEKIICVKKKSEEVNISHATLLTIITGMYSQTFDYCFMGEEVEHGLGGFQTPLLVFQNQMIFTSLHIDSSDL